MGPAQALTVDRVNRRIYVMVNPKELSVYDYEGNLIHSIKVPNIQNISFFNNKLWLCKFQSKEGTAIREHSLISMNLKTQKTTLVHTFKYEDQDANNRVKFFSSANFWVYENNLYWTHGIADHVYRIDQKNQIHKVGITFNNINRSFSDQIMSNYGFVNEYFYSRYQENMKIEIFLQKLSNQESLYAEAKITDDIYHTGSFYLKSSIDQHKLFFTKNYDQISIDLIDKFKMTNDDKLIIYSK